MEGGSTPVKLDHTVPGAQAAGQIVCKALSMRSLQNNRRSGQSNPIKVNQTCFKAASRQILERLLSFRSHSRFVVYWSLVLGHWSFKTHIYASRYIDLKVATGVGQS
jgi:hypothetical protein